MTKHRRQWRRSQCQVKFAESGDTEGLYGKYGLSAEHISAAAAGLMG